MANAQLTEEEANSKYQEGYNDSRYGSGGDFFDEIFELAEGIVDGIVEMSVTAMSLGVINFDSESEKEDRLQEIYDACRADLFFSIAILSFSIKKVLTYLCVWFKINNCVGTPSSSSKSP